MGLNCLLGSHQKVIRNSLIAYNSTIHLYPLDATGYWLFSTLFERNNYFFWFRTQSGPFCGVFWQLLYQAVSDSAEKRLSRFWPQVVLIILQIPFKKVCKTRILYRHRVLPTPFCSRGAEQKGGDLHLGGEWVKRGNWDFWGGLRIFWK